MARVSQIAWPSADSVGTLPEGEWRRICALRVRPAQLDVDLRERDAGVPHGEPGPQAPARGVLVADHQPIAHGVIPPDRCACRQLSFPATLPIMSLTARLHPDETIHAGKRKDQAGAGLAAVLLPADAKRKSIPVWLARDAGWRARGALTASAEGLGRGAGPQGQRRASTCCCPAPTASSPAWCWGSARSAPAIRWTGRSWPSAPCRACCRRAATTWPTTSTTPELAAVAWGLGAYRFRRYKSRRTARRSAQLKVPRGADHAARAWPWSRRSARPRPHQHAGQRPGARGAGGRRPAARRSTAPASPSIVGDDLLAENFPMIHAVGRASDRAPAPDRHHLGTRRRSDASRWSARASASTPAASTSSRRAAC